MSDSFLRLDPADRAKKLDAEFLNVGGIDVYRLRVSSVGGAGPGGGLTDAELRATPVPVSGTFWQGTQPVSIAAAVAVTGTFWQATQPVSGTFFQATQPVSIAGTVQVDVTDEPARQLGIISVTGSVGVTGTFWQATQPVSGTFWQATQPVSGTFWQATQPVSGPLTDTQLRATPVPVSGTLAVNVGLTDAQLRATAVPISAANLDVALSTRAAEATLVAASAKLNTSYGKTVSYVPVAQGAPGTTVLVAASAPNKHKLMGCVLTMGAAGTLKFLDSVGDLTGAMDILASGGFVLPTGLMPFTETGAINRSLSITTTGGSAKGVVAVLTEP